MAYGSWSHYHLSGALYPEYSLRLYSFHFPRHINDLATALEYRKKLFFKNLRHSVHNQ
jgi:hypothetical protein